jgi:hypothetical protein
MLLSVLFLLNAGGPVTAEDARSTTERAGKSAPLTSAGLALGSGEKRTVYQGIVNTDAQDVASDQVLRVGEEAPARIQLSELPKVVRSQIPALTQTRYAKLTNGDVILVNPESRRIVAIVTKDEGSL